MSDSRQTRRRFIQISGAVALGAASGVWDVAGVERGERECWVWEGVLFGADVTIRLYGMGATRSAALTRECFRRMRELERQFSLYISDSAICRLNREGSIERPHPEFVEVLRRARHYSIATEGAFDVTIQPVWQCCRDYAGGAGGEGRDPGAFQRKLREALRKTGFEKLDIGSNRVRFLEPGMALTLNGIAQGYITDRVAAFLKAEGVESTLIHLGEYRVIGRHPAGRAWRLGVSGAGAADRAIDSIELESGALAVSGGHGQVFERIGRHHLIHPLTGFCQRPERTVAVTAATATEADALSTACGVVDDPTARSLASRLGVGLRLYPA